MQARSFLIIITGGIAAYKSLELIRILKNNGARVIAVMTKSACEFITPLSVSALSGEKCYTDLFDLTDEQEMGHIKLAKFADAIIIAPATADFIAKMAHGIADDLPSTIIAATKKPIFIAPSMNPAMWENLANQDNIKLLTQRGMNIIPPNSGAMACGDIGQGRLAEPIEISEYLKIYFANNGALAGKKIVVSAGPTIEKLDSVRYLSNFSSGKQGFAIANSLAKHGAEVYLVAGNCALSTPENVNRINILSALDMLDAITNLLPCDAFIGVAAVADWRAREISPEKIKKNGDVPQLDLVENPDIIKTIGAHKLRPKLLIGFAAETFDAVNKAIPKYAKKNLDLILVNDIGLDNKILGGDNNHIIAVQKSAHGEWITDDWGYDSKSAHAERLCEFVIGKLVYSQNTQ